MFQIVFVDIHPKWEKSFRQVYNDISKNYVFQSNITCIETSISRVRDKYPSDKIVAYTSPANSYGYMDGGIDKIYAKMFVDIPKQVRQRIKNEHNGILPIGQSLLFEIRNKCYLITSPTMKYPMDVSDTNNAYEATLSTLNTCANAHPSIDILFLPGMCTGTGHMDLKTAIRQMLEAIKTFETIVQ